MCARVMAHLFSDIRNMGWQTLYSNMALIAQPRKNTSDHASHTRHGLRDGSRSISADAQGFCISVTILVSEFTFQAQDRSLKSGYLYGIACIILNVLVTQIFLPHLSGRESTRLISAKFQILQNFGTVSKTPLMGFLSEERGLNLHKTPPNMNP